jgi:hypothetical protein
MKKHTILFVAAGTNGLALDREARAIQVELERGRYRDRFEFETRWAVEPLDLLRELRTLRPTVVHFSGRDRIASTAALAETFGAAGTSVELVVLGACYPEAGGDSRNDVVDVKRRLLTGRGRQTSRLPTRWRGPARLERGVTRRRGGRSSRRSARRRAR